MKTIHRRILPLTQSLFLFAAFIGLALSLDAAAQPEKRRPAATRSKKIVPKPKPPKKEYVTWNVSYTVTIKGNGEQKGELQGEPDIKWSVDRSFVGNMLLDGPTALRDDEKIVPGWESYENFGPKANPPAVKVIVKDRIEKFLEGPGEIATHENRTDVTIWEEDAVETGSSDWVTTLAVNPETRTYWVVLPLVLPSTTKNVRKSRYTVFERSAVGYGGRPTHEVTKPLEDMIGIGEIAMPRGDHLVSSRSGSWITSTKPKQDGDKLPVSYPYMINLPKTCFQPTEPFFEGIADSKTKVDICVEFLLTKAVR